MKKLTILIMAVLLLFQSPQPVLAVENNRNETLVIVLDPGHDLTHGGANANGLSESKLNFKIAQYCYEELSTYSNVKVYMTRDSLECPFPEVFGATNEVGKDNEKRVKFASKVGADVYVSLHLNSCTDPSYGGAEVYVPNNNYRSKIGKEGKELGESILEQLGALGLKKNGVFSRNSEDGTKYPDGSLADYYGVIKAAKKANIPGIIVEHAYISGYGDAENFLSTDAKLKALGVADATGIAEYYGLVKDGEGGTATDPEDVAGTDKETEEDTGTKDDTESEADTGIKDDTETEADTGTKDDTESETDTGMKGDTESETDTGTKTDTEGGTDTEEESRKDTQAAGPSTEKTQTGEQDKPQGNVMNWVLVIVLLLGCVGCIAIIVILLKKLKEFH